MTLFQVVFDFFVFVGVNDRHNRVPVIEQDVHVSIILCLAVFIELTVEVENEIKEVAQLPQVGTVAVEVDSFTSRLLLGEVHRECAGVEDQAVYVALVFEKEVSDAFISQAIRDKDIEFYSWEQLNKRFKLFCSE